MRHLQPVHSLPDEAAAGHRFKWCVLVERDGFQLIWQAWPTGETSSKAGLQCLAEFRRAYPHRSFKLVGVEARVMEEVRDDRL